MRSLYILALSNVHGNSDDPMPLAASISKEALKKWEQEQRAPEPYETEPHADAFGYTHGYHLVYKDGPLKWFNPGYDPGDSFGGFFEVNVGDITDDELRRGVLTDGLIWVPVESVVA